MRAVAAILAGLLLWSSPCGAWERAREVVHGSARVLEKGETLVGILSPLGYGLHERVTVFTHPALLLLLTPQVWFRLAALDKESALSVESGYQQSFLALTLSDEDDTEPDRSQGFFQLGLSFSQALGTRVQVSAAAGYLMRFWTLTTDLSEHDSGLYWRASAHWLLTPADLFLAEVRGHWLNDGQTYYPSGTLLYARQLGRTRLGLGAAVGKFELSTNFTSAVEGTTETLYVYPWFDLWWRF